MNPTQQSPSEMLQLILMNNLELFIIKFNNANLKEEQIFQFTYIAIENDLIDFIKFLIPFLNKPNNNENQLIEIAYFFKFYHIVDLLCLNEKIISTLKNDEPEIFNYFVKNKIQSF
jgi:hypothetical protein